MRFSLYDLFKAIDGDCCYAIKLDAVTIHIACLCTFTLCMPPNCTLVACLCAIGGCLVTISNYCFQK